MLDGDVRALRSSAGVSLLDTQGDVAAWHQPAANAGAAFAVSPQEVHVWRADLQEHACRLQVLAAALSEDELDHASRFRLDRDRNRFILRRGMLRALLGRYLSIDPKNIRLAYGRYEKPFLDARCHPERVSFNMTWSRTLALYAVTRGRAVGIDVEFVEPLSDLEGVERSLSKTESAAVALLPPHARPLAFFRCWTRKEAYAKALGEGLSRRLELITTTPHPGRASTAPVELRDEDRRWRIETLSPASGYVGAIAAEGVGWRTTLWNWPPEL